MRNILAKKNILILSGFATLFFIVSAFPEQIGICEHENLDCIQGSFTVFKFLMPISLVFFFSAIIYPLREEIFSAWIRFTRWAVPLSVILISLAPDYEGGWMVLFPHDKGRVSVWLTGIFFVVSIGIILYKYMSSRKK